MTAALAGHVDRLELAPERGVSPRAVRSVLKMMAKIANDEGEFRYGLRGSKLAALTDYSLSVVRRAQRYLVDHGYLERVAVGGGRASTRWRIVIHKLSPELELRHTSTSSETRQPERRDTAQSPVSKFFRGMNRRGQPEKINTPRTAAEVLNAPVCGHGFDVGTLRDGRPKCPMCRRGLPVDTP